MGGGDNNDPKENESRLALAEQAAIQHNRYQDIFVPLENMFIADARSQFDEQNYNNAMGRAATQTSAIYERGLDDLQRAAFNRGLDPTSGAYQEDSAALRAAQARGIGLAAADAGISNTDRGYQMLSNVVQMGQGLQSEAMSGQIDVAQQGVDRARRQAERDFMRSSSLQGMAGTATGMAAGYGLRQGGYV
tara:strand:- start:622 stop:1194 length:573 start_codon:yes stop_codon:yes gene_type:complete